MPEDVKEEMLGLLEDLTDIARTGERVSIVSGFYLVWWGSVVSIACLIILALARLGLPNTDIYVWPTSMFLGWVGSKWIGWKLPSSKTGQATRSNRTVQYVWVSIGLAASLVTIGEATGFIDFGGRAYFLAFILCAIGLVMTAAAADERLLLLSGGGWFVMGFATLFFQPAQPVIYSATVLACLVFLVVPGLIIGTRPNRS